MLLVLIIIYCDSNLDTCKSCNCCFLQYDQHNISYYYLLQYTTEWCEFWKNNPFIIKGATRILLRGGLKIEHFCDVILITYFRWRNLMTSPKWRHNWYFWSFIT